MQGFARLCFASLLMMVAAVAVSGRARDPVDDYRERPWVDVRVENLCRGLALREPQAQRIRSLLIREHHQALRDRKALNKRKSYRGDESRSRGGRGLSRDFGRSRGEGADAPAGNRAGVAPNNPELLKRARMRYRMGDEKIMAELSAEQVALFREVCPDRREYPDAMVMLMEKLDLNDTQVMNILPKVRQMEQKIATIRSLGGERSARFEAVESAVTSFRESVKVELNKKQKKIFNTTRSQRPSGQHGRGMGRGMGRAGR